MELSEKLKQSAEDVNVVGFKSVVCYRSGMAVSLGIDGIASLEEQHDELFMAFSRVFQAHQGLTNIRLQEKALNDYVVRMTLRIAGMYGKPGVAHPIVLHRIAATNDAD